MEEHEPAVQPGTVAVFRSAARITASATGDKSEPEKGVCALKVTQTDREQETELRIEGVLDAVTAIDMRAVADSVVNSGRLQVRLDLAPLRLIDSSGVGTLVSLYKRVRAKGGSVTVVGLRDQPLAVFRLLRLDHIFVA